MANVKQSEAHITAMLNRQLLKDNKSAYEHKQAERKARTRHLIFVGAALSKFFPELAAVPNDLVESEVKKIADAAHKILAAP